MLPEWLLGARAAVGVAAGIMDPHPSDDASTPPMASHGTRLMTSHEMLLMTALNDGLAGCRQTGAPILRRDYGDP